MVIGEIMTRDPATAPVTATISEVVEQLFELDVRHLPIVDGSRLQGIVSDRDVRQFLTLVIDDDAIEKRREALESPVTEYMAANLITVTEETDVSEAIDLMLDQRIGAIPVVSPDTGDLVGIVSYVDILKGVQDLL
jgi:acetoin utilization protein AcuB